MPAMLLLFDRRWEDQNGALCDQAPGNCSVARYRTNHPQSISDRWEARDSRGRLEAGLGRRKGGCDLIKDSRLAFYGLLGDGTRKSRTGNILQTQCMSGTRAAYMQLMLTDRRDSGVLILDHEG